MVFMGSASFRGRRNARRMAAGRPGTGNGSAVGGTPPRFSPARTLPGIADEAKETRGFLRGGSKDAPLGGAAVPGELLRVRSAAGGAAGPHANIAMARAYERPRRDAAALSWVACVGVSRGLRLALRLVVGPAAVVGVGVARVVSHGAGFRTLSASVRPLTGLHSPHQNDSTVSSVP